MKHLLFVAVAFYALLTRSDVIAQSGKTSPSAKIYNEYYRPQFHFTPAENWSNDPNGLVYFDGEYHLFYQYYPLKMEWGPMHWGHAVSTDLMHWKPLPVALVPDSLGYIFSGSVVIDEHNASGFQTGPTKPMVAIFTYFVPETKLQTQAIAFSNDRGRTWRKYDGNPVLKNPGLKDFRDPKVRWHEPTQKWIMILACGDHVRFYSSPDLKNWTEEGFFGKNPDLPGKDWDCPDLFPVKVKGASDKKWVLTINSSGAPDGGRGVHYYTGSFDGRHFKADDMRPRWLEQGQDLYAGVTYNHTAPRTIFTSWIENWPGADAAFPDYRWRGAMTLPVELAITKTDDAAEFVAKKPVAEINKLETRVYKDSGIKLSKGPFIKNFAKSELASSVLRVHLELNRATVAKVKLKNHLGQSIDFVYDSRNKKVHIEKNDGGRAVLRPESAQVHHFDAGQNGKEIMLEIYYDRSVVEAFFNHGRWMTTDLVFPTVWYDTIELSADHSSGIIKELEVASLRSIWK